jgi:hypothetical protein
MAALGRAIFIDKDKLVVYQNAVEILPRYTWQDKVRQSKAVDEFKGLVIFAPAATNL